MGGNKWQIGLNKGKVPNLAEEIRTGFSSISSYKHLSSSFPFCPKKLFPISFQFSPISIACFYLFSPRTNAIQTSTTPQVSSLSLSLSLSLSSFFLRFFLVFYVFPFPPFRFLCCDSVFWCFCLLGIAVSSSPAIIPLWVFVKSFVSLIYSSFWLFFLMGFLNFFDVFPSTFGFCLMI